MAGNTLALDKDLISVWGVIIHSLEARKKHNRTRRGRKKSSNYGQWLTWRNFPLSSIYTLQPTPSSLYYRMNLVTNQKFKIGENEAKVQLHMPRELEAPFHCQFWTTLTLWGVDWCVNWHWDGWQMIEVGWWSQVKTSKIWLAEEDVELVKKNTVLVDSDENQLESLSAWHFEHSKQKNLSGRAKRARDSRFIPRQNLNLSAKRLRNFSQKNHSCCSCSAVKILRILAGKLTSSCMI